jgi:hypothetical protein
MNSKAREVLGQMHTLLGERDIMAVDLLEEAVRAGILAQERLEALRTTFRKNAADTMLRALDGILTIQERRRAADTRNDLGAGESIIG